MNATQLKKWQERQREDAEGLLDQIGPTTPGDIRKHYPEFDLGTCYTTSLDPYTPLWVLLPFFEKVIVGITPYLKTEEAFRDWYGVTPRRLLDLHEQGHVVIRVLPPESRRGFSIRKTMPRTSPSQGPHPVLSPLGLRLFGLRFGPRPLFVRPGIRAGVTLPQTAVGSIVVVLVSPRSKDAPGVSDIPKPVR